jgi:hypothetical protein
MTEMNTKGWMLPARLTGRPQPKFRLRLGRKQAGKARESIARSVGWLTAAGLLLAVAATTARGDDEVDFGLARITDTQIAPATAYEMLPEPAPVSSSAPCGDSFADGWGSDWSGGFCYEEKGLGKTGFGRWFNQQSAMYRTRNQMQAASLHAAKINEKAKYRARNQHQSAMLKSHLRCKYGYFIPTGCGGAGCPPLGGYKRVYAVDPGYFDMRDGGIYAAQGYGVPIAVPLAPTVLSTYNYSWGVPASRLTPVTHPIP